MKNGKLIIIIVIVLTLGAIVYFLPSKSSDNTNNTLNQVATQSKDTITHTDSGFSPSTITIKQGGTVTFENQSSGSMWVASSVHPTHQDYPAFDQLKGVGKGGTYSFVFDKKGSWRFHNHLNALRVGIVVVE